MKNTTIYLIGTWFLVMTFHACVSIQKYENIQQRLNRCETQNRDREIASIIEEENPLFEANANSGAFDSDGDNIDDSLDACPDVAGSIEMNGCPDSDEDGVADNEDQCLDTPGSPENMGCPEILNAYAAESGQNQEEKSIEYSTTVQYVHDYTPHVQPIIAQSQNYHVIFEIPDEFEVEKKGDVFVSLSLDSLMSRKLIMEMKRQLSTFDTINFNNTSLKEKVISIKSEVTHIDIDFLERLNPLIQIQNTAANPHHFKKIGTDSLSWHWVITPNKRKEFTKGKDRFKLYYRIVYYKQLSDNSFKELFKDRLPYRKVITVNYDSLLRKKLIYYFITGEEGYAIILTWILIPLGQVIKRRYFS